LSVDPLGGGEPMSSLPKVLRDQSFAAAIPTSTYWRGVSASW
jgi:hypothetical protein